MSLAQCLPDFGKELLCEIENHGVSREYNAGDYVVQAGQIVRFLPIVISGNVRVFSQEDSIEFLLYYISSGESCIFSFAHLFHETHLEFSAQAETKTELLLLPIDKVREWCKTYPHFVNMILAAYQKHYQDLLRTTKEMVCYGLEARLVRYLKAKVEVHETNLLHISHQEMALDLGSSREVITRLMRKLEVNGVAQQEGRKIRVY